MKKKGFFKILQNSQETPVLEETPMNFSKFLRIPFLQNNSGRLLLKGGDSENKTREIDCLSFRELDAMLIASTKIPEREGRVSSSSFYGHLPDS